MSRFEDRVREVEGILGDKVRKPVESYEGFQFGDRVVLLEDTEFAFQGEEGTLVIEQVGAAEYGNLRTSLAVIADGTDCPEEVSPLDIKAV